MITAAAPQTIEVADSDGPGCDWGGRPASWLQWLYQAKAMNSLITHHGFRLMDLRQVPMN